MNWTERASAFAAGMSAGVNGLLLLGASRPANEPAAPVARRPVEVTLHRFDMQPGQKARFREWIAFLHARHGEAVATLGRERTYFEVMFTSPDEPRRLYWLTVQVRAARKSRVRRSTSTVGTRRIWGRC